MQVTTPSWPAAGSSQSPRQHDGNSLGCISDNNILVSQHFFALKLTKDDLVKVLKALANASVVTDIHNRQVVSNGGPPDVQQLVNDLGAISGSEDVLVEKLSGGVELISKPSNLNVPPWQMVSAELGGVNLRAATWWQASKIWSTTKSTRIKCWSDSLSKPGAVAIATSGQFGGTDFGLKGGANVNGNHAKIGVSTSQGDHYAIFGDMNQEGTLSGEDCSVRQNGRGGLFYVIDDETLSGAVSGLINGETAPTHPPPQ